MTIGNKLQACGVQGRNLGTFLGYGATMPDKLGGALVSTDEKYCITTKLITIKLYD